MPSAPQRRLPRWFRLAGGGGNVRRFVSSSPRCDGQFADRATAGRFGLIHVLDDQGRVSELPGGHRAYDIDKGEVLDTAFKVECRDKTVVALFAEGRLGQLGQPGIIRGRATFRDGCRLDLETGR